MELMKNYSRRSFVGLAGAGIAATAAATVAAAATAMAGGLLTGCSDAENPGPGTENTANTGGGGNASANEQVIVAMGATSEPAAGFDPFVSWGCGEHVHEPLIQSTLVSTTIDMQFTNDLATDWSVSPDGLTWTFTIRDDVRFTDGEPLTASDVAFTINGIRDSDSSEADLTMIREAEATSDTEVVLTLDAPHNALLYTLAVVGIVPEHAHGSDYGTHPIGSGRYMLEQWDQGQQVILIANPDYYGEVPQIPRVIVVFLEEDAALAAVRAGEVDIAYTSAVFSDQQIADYELFVAKTVDSRGISLPVSPAGSVGHEDATAGNDTTSDVVLRRALSYAIDRESLVSNVLNGYGTAAYSVSDGMPWASEDMKVPFDVATARQMLAEAGYEENADGILEKSGRAVAFDLWYSASDSLRQALAHEFSNQMALLGIQVEPKGAGWDEIYAHSYTDPILWGWGSNSPAEIYHLNHSSGWGNFSGYSSAVTDGYLDEALATPTLEESYPLWQKAQWDGTEGFAPKGAATWVWLANIDHLYFKRNNLEVAAQKLHPHGHGWSLVNNIDQWSWA
jgi:peptide/nickel transport system substrate-binding protein